METLLEDINSGQRPTFLPNPQIQGQGHSQVKPVGKSKSTFQEYESSLPGWESLPDNHLDFLLTHVLSLPVPHLVGAVPSAQGQVTTNINNELSLK